MEWTTQSDEALAAAEYGNGHDTQPLPAQPPPPPPQPPVPPAAHPHLPEESVTPPVISPPPPIPTHAAPAPSATPQANPGYEQCPSCGAMVAVDQRYCLECGHRRGEPRLPFMDAVVFMDAMNKPPESAAAAAKPKKRGISPNTALIAGVGTLLLALGIGVLIGRSGEHSSAPASQAPIVIHGGTREEAAKTASSGGETIGGGSTAGKSKKQVVKAKQQAAENGEGAKEVLHYSSKAKPPAKPTAAIGEKCTKGTAGCSGNGEFNGSFFGE